MNLDSGGELTLDPGANEQVLVVLHGELTATGLAGTDDAEGTALGEGGVVFLKPGDGLAVQAGPSGALLIRTSAGTPSDSLAAAP